MTFWRRLFGEEAPPVVAEASDIVAPPTPDPLAPLVRDTDADWSQIAVEEPYWGVLSDPRFRRENLTPATIEAFYASGVDGLAGIVGELERAVGAPVHARSALDFGCGLGRLTEAMTLYADKVTGIDIAPAMLEAARARGGTVRYVDALPDERFDWINSFIVFQHIPPARGLGLLEELLTRLEPSGLFSLQFTVWSEPHLRQPPGGFDHAPGSISMYDYDFGAIVEMLGRYGIRRFSLVSGDHGGHRDAHIFGRRSAEPAPQP